MHSSIAYVRYGLHVQMSEPNTSEPLPTRYGQQRDMRGEGQAHTLIVYTEGKFLRLVGKVGGVADCKRSEQVTFINNMG